MDRTLIDEAVRALSVQAVLLHSSRIRADDALLPPANQDLAVVAQFRASPADEFEIVEVDDDTGKVVVVIFRFSTGVRLVDHTAAGASKAKTKRDASTVRLEILAEFATHYRVREDTDTEALRPALEEFGRCNVGFHVWPYWREYVQATCARMGIPVIPIGMYRLPSTPEPPPSSKKGRKPNPTATRP